MNEFSATEGSPTILDMHKEIEKQDKIAVPDEKSKTDNKSGSDEKLEASSQKSNLDENSELEQSSEVTEQTEHEKSETLIKCEKCGSTDKSTGEKEVTIASIGMVLLILCHTEVTLDGDG